MRSILAFAHTRRLVRGRPWDSVSAGHARGAASARGTTHEPVVDAVSAATLDQLQMARSLTHVQSLLGAMRAKGRKPTLIHYHVAMDRAGKEGASTGLLQLFDELVGDGHSPTVVTINTTLQAYEKTGQWKQAMRLFDSMASEYGVRPNVISYSSLIAALARGRQWRQARHYFEQSLAAGLVPSPLSFEVAIMACAKGEGNWERARQLIEMMRTLKLGPNASWYVPLGSFVCHF